MDITRVITRGELGDILSAHTSSRTVKAGWLKENSGELTDDWLVTYLEVDDAGVLEITCCPPCKNNENGYYKVTITQADDPEADYQGYTDYFGLPEPWRSMIPQPGTMQDADIVEFDVLIGLTRTTIQRTR